MSISELELSNIFGYLKINCLNFIKIINERNNIEELNDIFINITENIDKNKSDTSCLVINIDNMKYKSLEKNVADKIYECIAYFLNGNYYASLEGVVVVEYWFQNICDYSNIRASFFEKITKDNYTHKYLSISSIIKSMQAAGVNIDYFFIYIYGDGDDCINLRNKFSHGDVILEGGIKIRLYACYLIVSLFYILNKLEQGVCFHE